MGTKRQIADQVAAVLDRAPSGPCLELFAGMSAVGRATADCRNLWCNDVQHFATAAARAFFTASRGPARFVDVLPKLKELFLQNRSLLTEVFKRQVEIERNALAAGTLELLMACSQELLDFCAAETATVWRNQYVEGNRKVPYCLFSITYAGGFVGLQQAIDIDSLRYAIDELRASEKITDEMHRWMIVALCYALANISNSTGHFAQYLAIKESTKWRYMNKRKRDVWRTWYSAMLRLKPLGTAKWRRRNKIFRSEAIELLANLAGEKVHPAVVYGDPPYTSDHYSRYYHLWETLVLYDYPLVMSKGQYRSDRFYSSFSVKTRAIEAFRGLIENAGKLRSALVISYPENGIFAESTPIIMGLLEENFQYVEIAAEINHEHSSLGASKGEVKTAVVERIFLARH
jgi:adenine-specific DNA-methyltransferase